MDLKVVVNKIESRTARPYDTSQSIHSGSITSLPDSNLRKRFSQDRHLNPIQSR